MKYLVTASATPLKTKPNSSVIRNLLKNEVVESYGPPRTHKKETWLNVKIVHGPVLAGYARKDDLEKLEVVKRV